ncbi:hypothetical protein PRIC2_000209 [Phytophthora ramorum]
MDTLHAQKENVDANALGGATGKTNFAGPDKFTTPKRGFVIHDDSKSTGKKGIKENSTKKSRRVLGDISNKQQHRRSEGNASVVGSIKKTGLGKGLGHSKKLSIQQKIKTPLKSKAVASLKPKTMIQPLQVEEVPDIEFAYGGLSSPNTDSAHWASLRDEFVRDIINDTTPTLFDDFDPTDVVAGWDDEREKAMLKSGEPPSPWWSSADQKEDTEEEKEEEHVHDDLDDLPPPDNLPDDEVADFDDDGLLGDLLSVDVEAACTE